MSAAIEWNLIGQVIWVSLVAAIGATVLFSLVVFGSSRAAESRRSGTNPAGYAALAAAALASFLAAVVLAVLVILDK
jgi:hypothetical protein